MQSEVAAQIDIPQFLGIAVYKAPFILYLKNLLSDRCVIPKNISDPKLKWIPRRFDSLLNLLFIQSRTKLIAGGIALRLIHRHE